MTEVLTAPVIETPKLSETELQQKVTPAVARGMYTAVDKKFLNPDQKTPTPEETASLSSKTEQDIPYRALAEVSLDSRKKYWENRIGKATVSFAQQNAQWNTETADLLRNSAALADPDLLYERREAFISLGLNLEDQTTWETKNYEFKSTKDDAVETVTLVAGIEEFRKKYLRSHSKIQQFVSDIADGCRPAPDQPVNMELLKKRLAAVSLLTTSFGEEYSISKLINQFALSHGLLTQSGENKQLLALTAEKQLSEPLPDDLNNGFKALANMQREIDEIPEKAKQQAEEQIKEERAAKQEISIKQKVEEAKSTALSDEGHDTLLAEEEEIERKFATGEYSSAKRSEEIKKIEEKHGGIMQFENVDEFKQALKLLGKSYHQIAEDAKHEQAHFEAASKHGLNPVYEIHISRGSGDHIQPHVMVRYNFPSGPSEEEIRKKVQEIMLSPGLLHISRNDAAGAGYEWTDVEDARTVVNIPHIAQSIENMSKGSDAAKQAFEYAVLQGIQSEREKTKHIFENENIPVRTEPPSPPSPTEASDEELLNEYLSAAIRISGAPDAKLDAIKNDEELKTRLIEIVKNAKGFNENFFKLKSALMEIIDDPKFTIHQTASLSTALIAHKDGAAILLPIGNRHMGLLEKEANNIIKDESGQLMAKVRDMATGKTILLPLRSILQSEASFMNGLAQKGADNPDTEDIVSLASPVFIMQKTA